MFLQSLLQEQQVSASHQQLSEHWAQTVQLQREKEELLRREMGQVLTACCCILLCCMHVAQKISQRNPFNLSSVELYTLFCFHRMHNRSIQCIKGQMSSLPQLSIHNTTTTERQPYSQQMVKHSPSMGCDHHTPFLGHDIIDPLTPHSSSSQLIGCPITFIIRVFLGFIILQVVI